MSKRSRVEQEENLEGKRKGGDSGSGRGIKGLSQC